MARQCALVAQKNQLYAGLYQKQCGQQAEGGDFALLPCSGETPPGVLCPVLWPPI